MISGYPLIAKNKKRVMLLAYEPPPWFHVEKFPAFCGAGKGWREKAIPETMYRAKVSPACWQHDIEWDVAEPTWEDFHAANSRFLHNLQQLVSVQSGSKIMLILRYIRCNSYYMAVDIAGAAKFWELKRRQGYDITARYANKEDAV